MPTVKTCVDTFAEDEIDDVEDKLETHLVSSNGVVFGAAKGRRLGELFVEASGAGRHFVREEHGGVPARASECPGCRSRPWHRITMLARAR